MKCNQNCLKNAGNPRDMRRFQVCIYMIFGYFISICIITHVYIQKCRILQMKKNNVPQVSVGMNGIIAWMLYV